MSGLQWAEYAFSAFLQKIGGEGQKAYENKTKIIKSGALRCYDALRMASDSGGRGSAGRRHGDGCLHLRDKMY